MWNAVDDEGDDELLGRCTDGFGWGLEESGSEFEKLWKAAERLVGLDLC